VPYASSITDHGRAVEQRLVDDHHRAPRGDRGAHVGRVHRQGGDDPGVDRRGADEVCVLALGRVQQQP